MFIVSVTPDQEYLQQTHLICSVPAYLNPDIQDPVTVNLFIVSNGKSSEAHNFVYTPISYATTPTNLAATSLVVESKAAAAVAADRLSKGIFLCRKFAKSTLENCVLFNNWRFKNY